ncbi:MAG: tRNA (N6-isopentenyl adenosine(37)-C2)-methylthiotransferase MiaB, partial [Candidatus Peregrinibacteria bacterium]|nr:tRNA (N6-isopentenyl adenosine(37)-C2)-methylthiotransferase MiaB [Candidatus Peregrinibacteria bacterium]
PVDHYEKADLVILNTCMVKESAENRIYGLGEPFEKLKKENPKMKIGITGCMITKDSGLRGQSKEEVLRRMPTIDFVFRIKDLMHVPDMLTEMHHSHGADEVKEMQSYFHISPKITNITQVFIPIMSGCNNFCSFCIVPYTRGRNQCRDISEIMEEVEKMAKRGATEVNFVGQNVNTYEPTDHDPNSSDSPFTQLLRRVDAVPGIKRIRFYTVHPQDMGDDVIALYGELKSMVPHLHLPVQSGSDSCLQRMNRHYSVDRFKELVNKMRARMPDMSISTDIITGFCGETEEEFMGSLNLIKDCKIDLVYVSKYSQRPNTLASKKFEDDIPFEVKRERFERITEAMKEVSAEYLQKFVGKTVEVLVEKVEKGFASGKIPEFKLCRFKADDVKLVGEYVKVKVTDSKEWVLEGEAIQNK